MTDDGPEHNHLAKAARGAARREERREKDPEPSLGRRFGQIGVLGWMIVIPILGGLVLGGLLDWLLGTGIAFEAALMMAGAVLGLWLAFRWMHEQ